MHKCVYKWIKQRKISWLNILFLPNIIWHPLPCPTLLILHLHLVYTLPPPSLYSSSTLFILLLHLIYTPFPPDSGVEICRTNTNGKNSVCYFFLTFSCIWSGGVLILFTIFSRLGWGGKPFWGINCFPWALKSQLSWSSISGAKQNGEAN